MIFLYPPLEVIVLDRPTLIGGGGDVAIPVELRLSCNRTCIRRMEYWYVRAASAKVLQIRQEYLTNAAVYPMNGLHAITITKRMIDASMNVLQTSIQQRLIMWNVEKFHFFYIQQNCFSLFSVLLPSSAFELSEGLYKQIHSIWKYSSLSRCSNCTFRLDFKQGKIQQKESKKLLPEAYSLAAWLRCTFNVGFRSFPLPC